MKLVWGYCPHLQHSIEGKSFNIKVGVSTSKSKGHLISHTAMLESADMAIHYSCNVNVAVLRSDPAENKQKILRQIKELNLLQEVRPGDYLIIYRTGVLELEYGNSTPVLQRFDSEEEGKRWGLQVQEDGWRIGEETVYEYVYGTGKDFLEA